MSQKPYKILFLHHSTGRVIFNAGKETHPIIGKLFQTKAYVTHWFENYNHVNGTQYMINERFFPKKNTYGWNNYPFDYYNIWVRNAGEQPYLNEPTLEILTKQYDLIIFKHCFPVSDIQEDIHQPDINSADKRLENYKLQYGALKQKMHEFPQTKFLIWTGASRVKSQITIDQALRANFFLIG